jgi:hypothetical protein
MLAGAGVPLLAAVLATPPAARASCGDYVLIGSKVYRAVGHAQMPAGTDHHDSIPADPDPEPCSGPMCNGGAQLPAPLPVTMPPSQTEDGICLPVEPLPDDLRLVAFPAHEPAACPQGPRPSVYRPPCRHVI